MQQNEAEFQMNQRHSVEKHKLDIAQQEEKNAAQKKIEAAKVKKAKAVTK